MDKDNPVTVLKSTEPAAALGQMMLFPGTSFDVTLTLAKKSATDPEATATVNKIITPSMINETYTDFEAGKSYTFTFKVYGLEAVDITAELEDWNSVGNYEIDTDDKPTVY